MVVYDTNGSVVAIDFRETAPDASTPDMFHSNSSLSTNVGILNQWHHYDVIHYDIIMMSSLYRLHHCDVIALICLWQGGLAVGVPGELRGMELAHNRYGRYIQHTV